MRRKIDHFTNLISISAFMAAVLVLSGIARAESRSSVYIQENVKVEANTGGNTVDGSGEIKTGSARAESSSKTEVKSGGESKIEINAKAEANGKKVEAEVKEKNPKENISVSKEIKEGNSEAKVDIEISSDEPQGVENISTESNLITESPSNDQENKSIFAKAAESISIAIKNIFDQIVSFIG